MIDSRWPHFSREEIECPCCHLVRVSGEFMDKLEAIRQELNVPMKVNSACRCEKHNKEQKGAVGSSHLATDAHVTCAIDIRSATSETKWDLVCLARKHGMRQVIVYNNFLHIADDEKKPVFLSWGAY